jgi:hypothetical protein
MQETFQVNLSGKYGIGKKMCVDLQDKDIFINKKICVNAQGYCCMWKDRRSQYCHRVVLDIDDCKTEITYINGNKFDNRRCNLRVSKKGTANSTRDRTTQKQSDYQKAKVYRIDYKHGKDFYVGSTCNLLCQRLANHRAGAIKSPRIKLYRFVAQHGGWNNFTMTKIEDYPCEYNEKLRKREQYWKDRLQPTLNTQNCIFDKNRANFKRTKAYKQTIEYKLSKMNERHTIIKVLPKKPTDRAPQNTTTDRDRSLRNFLIGRNL